MQRNIPASKDLKLFKKSNFVSCLKTCLNSLTSFSAFREHQKLTDEELIRQRVEHAMNALKLMQSWVNLDPNATTWSVNV